MTLTREDIEAKARQIEVALAETKEAARNTAVMAGVAVVAVILIAYVWGRRRGGKAKTVVEVYRIR
ncbi:MAG: hypothetical protein R6X29_10885 [Acidimicrobiia bacterium]|jgi:hypothetical protein